MPSSLFGPRAVPQTNQQIQTPQSNGGLKPPANLAQIKSLMNMMNSGGNVLGMLTSMLMNNSQYAPIMTAISQHGGDARAAFYDLAAQKGTDPNEVLKWLQ